MWLLHYSGIISTIFTITAEVNGASLEPNTAEFIQTPEMTAKLIAVQKYGAVIIPASAKSEAITLKAEINGTVYTGATTINASSDVGTTVNMTK